MANEYRFHAITTQVLRNGDPAGANVRFHAVTAQVLRAGDDTQLSARFHAVSVQVLRSLTPASTGRRRQLSASF